MPIPLRVRSNIHVSSCSSNQSLAPISSSSRHVLRGVLRGGLREQRTSKLRRSRHDEIRNLKTKLPLRKSLSLSTKETSESLSMSLSSLTKDQIKKQSDRKEPSQMSQAGCGREQGGKGSSEMDGINEMRKRIEATRKNESMDVNRIRTNENVARLVGSGMTEANRAQLERIGSREV